MNKVERWSLIILEVLFGLCALSVLIYQFTDRFDFGFGVISYRFFNIAISLAVIVYIIYGLWKSKPQVLTVVAIFSLLHFTEGLIISFWYKVVIHFLILMIVCWHYYRNRAITQEGERQ
ncbi:MAG: hypothetical protein JKY50_19510 [Oleispira sp.]|nr:hypothetical protein [Oleispira sp.]MBL4880222.1 hypothetical protein [Oleispira sp.]